LTEGVVVKRARPGGLASEIWAFRLLQGHGAAELIEAGTDAEGDWIHTRRYPFDGETIGWRSADEQGVAETFAMLRSVGERLAAEGLIWRDALPKNIVYERPWRGPHAINLDPLERTTLTARQIRERIYCPFAYWMWWRCRKHLDVDTLLEQHWHPFTPAQIIDSMNHWHPSVRYQPIPFDGFEDHTPHRQQHDQQWAVLRQVLPDIRGATVVDAGCNLGYWTFRLREIGAGSATLFDKNRGCICVVRMIAAQQGVDRMDARCADLTTRTPCTGDILIHLNIHHWIAKAVGADRAEDLLRERARDASVLLFEAPDSFAELPARLGFKVEALPRLYKGRPFLMGTR